MKVLLLTDMPPCTNFTAGIVLDQLCRMLPKGSVACFAVPFAEVVPKFSPDLQDMPIKYHVRPREAWNLALPRRLQKVGSAISLLMETYNGCFKLGRIVSRAASFGREFGADVVWCVLEGQTMIRLAVPVARALGVPLLTEVWDPPQWWMRANRVDRISSRRILGAFARAIRESAACATASPAMAERYNRDYGTRTVPFLPSLDQRMALPPAEEVHPGSELVVAMGGQLYAENEWRALLKALNSVGWRICGRDVRLRLLGQAAYLTADGAARIEFLGWHGQEGAVKLLSEADVLYCAYWFDPLFRTEAELSFPSKLTTYLAAGRPVLFHGPPYASPARFIEEHKAGLCCYSLEPEQILRKLTELVSDQALYARTTRAGREAFDEYLTMDKLRESFARFLSLDKNILL